MNDKINFAIAFLATISSCFANANPPASDSENALKVCAYVAKETAQYKYPQMEPYENCASYLNGKLRLSPLHFSQLDFGASGLTSFWTHGQHFYIKADGSFLAVVSYDNGADWFAEGLVRSMVNGRIAYFNKDFKIVIPAKYDWGWPFSEGRALVCSGCRIQAADKDGHKPITGGKWGYINRQGEEIVPIQYSK